MIARVVSIVILGMAVNIFTPVAPSILGALVDYQGLSMDVAGRLISYNFWGGAAASVLAIFLLHRPGWNFRATMLSCLVLVIVTNGASVWFADNLSLLAVVRFVNGVGAGLGFTVSCVAAVCTRRIERTYAVLYGSPFLISGMGLALLPLVYRFAGVDGAFYGMGLINLLAILLLPYFPKTIGDESKASGTASTRMELGAGALAGLVLAALLLHYVFNSGIWTYFERLGVTAGMTPATAGAILGLGMGAAIVGMIGASLLGDRLGYMKPVYIGLAVITLSTLALLGSSSQLVFGVGTALFNASIPFVTPYIVAILALLIPSGFGVTAANIAIITGFSAGPFLISFIVADGTFAPAIWMSAAGFVVVWILLALFVHVLGRQTTGYDRLKALCIGPAGASEKVTSASRGPG